MTTLIGTNPDQIPVNAMLGGMAYQDPDSVSVKDLTSSGTASISNLNYSGTLTGGTGVINIGSGQVYKDASGNVSLGGTGALRLNVGTTAERPVSPLEGMVRKNSTNNNLEGYVDGEWEQLNGGKLLSVTTYTAVGDFVFSVNPAAKFLIVEMIGGGGGGGGLASGTASTNCGSISSFGGPGGYVKCKISPLQPTYYVKIGGGGEPGAADSPGLEGGSTRFGKTVDLSSNRVTASGGGAGLFGGNPTNPLPHAGVRITSFNPVVGGFPECEILADTRTHSCNWVVLSASSYFTSGHYDQGKSPPIIPAFSNFYSSAPGAGGAGAFKVDGLGINGAGAGSPGALRIYEYA